MSSMIHNIGLVFIFTASVLSASFPPTPQGLSILNSTNYPGVSLSYKETQICETTAGTKSYSGYIHLPPAPSEGRIYPINTFFWFFEARNDPENAPLSLWLQGGPGSPSIPAALGENGPCIVNIDSKSTTLNPWSWNENVNMLYIDQPVQTGFSYDVLTNGTIDEIESPFVVQVEDFAKEGLPETNITLLTGTFASQNISMAPVTTDMAAVAMWHFMQVWIQEFPKYRPQQDKFSIWAESYGGHYGPTFASFFKKQNSLIASGEIASPATQMQLDTVGLINACIDINTQMPFYPQFAFNNTYGIKAIDETQYKTAVSSFPKCKNLTDTCRSMAEKLDPLGLGNSSDVNKACYGAYTYCFDNMWLPYQGSGRYQFDITSLLPSSFPSKLAAGYLNEADVQQALGVPLNFTGNSVAVAVGFNVSGDFVKGHNLDFLGQLLDDGVKVALVYGDKDYQCNWLGGEAISLAIESKLKVDFSKAGYADIQTNSSYVGGAVRQYGNLSFSRVFEAGHEVPYYQPETAFQIFNRVMLNKDVATGQKAIESTSTTSGPSHIFSIKNKVSPPLERYCYLWDMLETCTPDEEEVVASGRAIVKDFILLGYTAANGTDVYYPNAASLGAGGGNTTSGSGQPLTSSAAGSRVRFQDVWTALFPLMIVVGLHITHM